MENYKETRPWGQFENLLERSNCKVKIITIAPGQSPSYQYHHKREEVWVVISGIGELKLNDKVSTVRPRDVLMIPYLAKHQITNTGNQDLVFVEVQLGEYFGEDDIVRIQDNYGRQ